ncbi:MULTISPECIES: Gfo/Idh/MocA family protein [Caldilinea]|jgi:predicted dehydrogenase|nr:MULTISPECIES: Gfo/Idh/MocA family oxidoreductase [Caldilinea]GIV73760.1 MAG: oxidoreductase [Caldilinea sp.]
MTIRFAAVGLAHPHIFDMARRLREAGARLVACWDDDPGNLAAFVRAFPDVERSRDITAIFEDRAVDLIVSAAVHDERAGLGVRAMRHEKDFLCTKPGFTTLEQWEEVRRVWMETGRRYIVYFGERFGNPATVLAGELIQQGAIGRVVHMAGFGPHRLFGRIARPPWLFQRDRYGGILNDLASHQIDQFLFFTGSVTAEIAAATVANHRHPQFPEFEDFGEVLLRSERATGYLRVDWLSPAGLSTWGDVRLFLQGTDGYIEVRKTCDLQGRVGGDHLFLVDHHGERYIHAADTPLPFMRLFLDDLRDRTERAVEQAHVFEASRLALLAQREAKALNRSTSV